MTLSRQYTKALATEDSPRKAIEVVKDDLDACSKEVQDIQDRIEEIDDILNDPTKVKMIKENFLNLMKKLEDKMRAGTLVQKDNIARILFSNITLDDKNKLIYLCKPEFDGLLKSSKKNFGAPD